MIMDGENKMKAKASSTESTDEEKHCMNKRKHEAMRNQKTMPQLLMDDINIT